jgi:HK97 family phage portal protein
MTDNIENPAVPLSSENILSFFGIGSGGIGELDINVTERAALGVPAVWAAVVFLSRTIAKLPLKAYRRDKSGNRQRIRGGVAAVVGKHVNPTLTSFEWRRGMLERVLLPGRHLTYIERAPNGRILNLWPLDTGRVTVREVVKSGVPTRSYDYHGTHGTIAYEAHEIIDISFMGHGDGLRCYGPLRTHRDTFARAIAVRHYSSKIFRGGGVPPFQIRAKHQTPAGMERASEQMSQAVARASKEGRQAIAVPEHVELEALGFEPQKMQMTDAERFCLEEIARVYNLPPVFLQDLSRATFSNAEQQDLHLVKHVITNWCAQIEEEINLKLFGRGKTDRYFEFDVDGLLRGDFGKRMEGWQKAISSGVATPNEARAAENRPAIPGGDGGFINGGSFPLEMVANRPPPDLGDQGVSDNESGTEGAGDEE